MQSISKRFEYLRLASSGMYFSCSAFTSAIACGFESSIAPSHVLVIDEVCWPAKRRTMSQPVTSESVKPRPAFVTFPVALSFVSA